jgi:hypothetical protein
VSHSYSDLVKTNWVEWDNLLVDHEVEYRYKGKSYCNDCYKRIYAVALENKNKTISSKMSKFGKGFKIPDDK